MPQQNRVFERRNCSLCAAARTLLTYANLPQYFLAEAVSTTSFTQNGYSINLRFYITPYEIINRSNILSNFSMSSVADALS